MLTTTYEMLQKAYEGHYAVPAINTQGGTYDIIRAVCMAAEELRSPVILAHYVNTGAYSGHDWFYETAKWMAGKVSVPVAIHLDHGDSFERCMEMLKLGFTSIMFDGSALPVEENAAATEAVARVCRSFGVPLEAEIGELCRLDDRGNKIGASNIADPDVVRQYLKLCHPDSLAIGIGNAHGFLSLCPTHPGNNLSWIHRRQRVLQRPCGYPGGGAGGVQEVYRYTLCSSRLYGYG